MSYIQRSSTNASVTPFDIGKMSGNTSVGLYHVFDSFNVSWLSFNSSTGVISSDDNFFTEACFSPNSNTYGMGRTGDTTGPSLYLQGQVLPESSTTSAGGAGRGDDVAYYYSNTQHPTWLWSAISSTSPDTSLAYLKIMRF